MISADESKRLFLKASIAFGISFYLLPKKSEAWVSVVYWLGQAIVSAAIGYIVARAIDGTIGDDDRDITGTVTTNHNVIINIYISNCISCGACGDAVGGGGGLEDFDAFIQACPVGAICAD